MGLGDINCVGHFADELDRNRGAAAIIFYRMLRAGCLCTEVRLKSREFLQPSLRRANPPPCTGPSVETALKRWAIVACPFGTKAAEDGAVPAQGFRKDCR